jgi:hypothetical protein
MTKSQLTNSLQVTSNTTGSNLHRHFTNSTDQLNSSVLFPRTRDHVAYAQVVVPRAPVSGPAKRGRRRTKRHSVSLNCSTCIWTVTTSGDGWMPSSGMAWHKLPAMSSRGPGRKLGVSIAYARATVYFSIRARWRPMTWRAVSARPYKRGRADVAGIAAAESVDSVPQRPHRHHSARGKTSQICACAKAAVAHYVIANIYIRLNK